ncbi:L-serine ammonia-lyase [Psittacicella melopsittaci]|uniref:L-serine dehydratase n=1 Tax=Psittacicella melopsittaci TaxID=2028576 RepID=A0A3A1Y5A8_9GAMM|nr:L-serine ammonia-lyase [Psittacicella melopsittaci]RIY32641.1 L-serine ammonia-lyase [Psittacicella melopsittaci]
MISIFDIFKIGVGPSSSHTVGPMVATYKFMQKLVEEQKLASLDRIEIDIYGSLSLTGAGHLTDVAVVMGLMGYLPENVEVERITEYMNLVKSSKKLPVWLGAKEISFCYDNDLNFRKEFLPRHENALTVRAFSQGQVIAQETYYSIGGGFVVTDKDFEASDDTQVKAPFDYKSAEDLLRHTENTGYSLSYLARKNELSLRSESELKQYCARIWQTMQECMQRGMLTEGLLPGPLKVRRRAPGLRKLLEADILKEHSDPLYAMDWLNLYAFAVNEENAAGGRVVTAPTNGACGIVPAVLAYYGKFYGHLTDDIVERYLLVCSLVGSLYKMNASISGAEVGCQGEVGVACSMAAAGFAEIMGGSPKQVFIAAEIAMEHNLGLTCDPVAGQVQVPCIERNAIASTKAVNSARMALRRVNDPSVSLDKVIETMYETGKDMNAKYRETSTGGLAIKVTNICA